MSVRKEHRFCTTFTRTDAEKRQADMSKELDATKSELTRLKEEMKALTSLVLGENSGKAEG